MCVYGGEVGEEVWINSCCLFHPVLTDGDVQMRKGSSCHITAKVSHRLDKNLFRNLIFLFFHEIIYCGGD